MSKFAQQPYVDVEFEDNPEPSYEDVEFADNPEPRCAVALLLDTSGSMRGRKLEQMIEGLKSFRNDVLEDTLAVKRIEVSIITFGPVEVHTEFTTVERLDTDGFVAQGNTPMGGAIKKGIHLLNERKMLYRQQGVSFYRPWIFLISDGRPTDNWQEVVDKVRNGEDQKEFEFFAVGVDEADMEILGQFSGNRDALKLKGLCFQEMFLWLSQSLRQVSSSAIDEKLRLPSPRGPDGWCEIE